ncbi:hypothetical protein [Pseudoteredinibacter isoporae]|uniref:hypothetical protein n=1 Tax=Pseudoteredinibacter isoporae TaxID=570281 RepID=UPI003103495C
MERLRPFFAQLQLARSQYQALCAADTAIAKLSFTRGGFYILGALNQSWLQQELAIPLSSNGASAVEQFNSIPDKALPQSVLMLKNSDWYADFLSVLDTLAHAATIDLQAPEDSATLIATAKSSPVLDSNTLKLCLRGFEQYFESQLSLNEEY